VNRQAGIDNDRNQKQSVSNFPRSTALSTLELRVRWIGVASVQQEAKGEKSGRHHLWDEVEDSKKHVCVT
jgi:hypothetical protein